MHLQPLKRNFYARDTHEVARDLLGKVLVRDIDGERLAGRICEVEAYVGEDDAACHASKGRTARTEVMYGAPGHAYVYLVYGMYDMLNFVTDREGFPAAVLVRGAGESDGPGKLTRAFQIDRSLNAHDLTAGEKLFAADDGFTIDAADIETSPRIGVDYAGDDANLPWRYFVRL